MQDQKTEPNLRLVLLAFGANLPGSDGLAPHETLAQAMDALEQEIGPFETRSGLYATPCFPAGAGPDYVNAAAAFRSALPARRILEMLHDLEARFGRARAQRWGMRTLDIDLIAVGCEIHPDPETQTHWREMPSEAQISATPDQLILPHPRLQDRGFVLVPLAEVAPDWRHPLSGLSVREMRDALPAEVLSGIERLHASG